MSHPSYPSHPPDLSDSAPKPAKTPFKAAASLPAPHSPLLSSGQLRKVQWQQEAFAGSLAARLSLLLRAEFFVTLAGLHLTPFQRLTESWPEPAHLTLFKTEPLRGVSILKIPTPLALSIVDRLMGGTGQTGATAREIGAIENALLEQVALVTATEWCRHWAQVKELKPVLLGCESNARFLQTAPPQAVMLVVVLDTILGGVQEQIQLAFPFATVEPLLLVLAPAAEIETVPAPAPSPVAPCAWNHCFDDVSIPVTGSWHGLKVAAREVLNLKVGDVLRMDPSTARRIEVRLGGHAKFQGRPGMVSGNWAVELTEVVKP